MTHPMDHRRTPAFPASGVPASSLSPAELAEVMSLSGSASVRAAFACGLASALLPVLVIVAQDPELARLPRMNYLAAAGFMTLALTSGLASFMDNVALWMAELVSGIASLTLRPLRAAIHGLTRQRVTGSSRAREQPLRGSDLRYDPGHSLSPRERRSVTRSVASHCAATFAALGASIACVTWILY